MSRDSWFGLFIIVLFLGAHDWSLYKIFEFKVNDRLSHINKPDIKVNYIQEPLIIAPLPKPVEFKCFAFESKIVIQVGACDWEGKCSVGYSDGTYGHLKYPIINKKYRLCKKKI